jgi:hypothetical protein
MKRLPLRTMIAVGVCAGLLMVPATALGQDALSNPSAAQYQPQSQIEGTNISGGGPTAGGPTASNSTAAPNNGPGSLPFTGMDLAVVAGAALLMIGAGFTLRRLSAPRTPGT